jgi:hypothetical protein
MHHEIDSDDQTQQGVGQSLVIPFQFSFHRFSPRCVTVYPRR